MTLFRVFVSPHRSPPRTPAAHASPPHARRTRTSFSDYRFDDKRLLTHSRIGDDDDDDDDDDDEERRRRRRRRMLIVIITIIIITIFNYFC